MSSTEPLTESELVSIEARHTKATPGEWFGGDVFVACATDRAVIAECNGKPNWSTGQQRANVAFVAAAHQDIPRLLSEVRRLQNERDFYSRTVMSLNHAIGVLARHTDMDDPDVKQEFEQLSKPH